MSALAALQREFMRSLFDARAPSADGIAVYSASVAANHAAALAATYPVVLRLVGESFFGEAARQFARVSASASGDLNEYGAGFAQFLDAYPHAAALAYLPDVARVEWACHECERAPDPQPFDFAALARVPAPDYAGVRLTLHPGVRLVRSQYPVAAIHAANQPSRDGVPARTEGGDCVVVHRAGFVARVQAVAEYEWRFLERLAHGDPLAAASDVVPRERVEEFLAAAPARYVREGIVSGFAAPGCA
jgi:uncharacterized protein